MKDLIEELQAVQRLSRTGRLPAGEAQSARLSRRYDADVDDVWDAVTTPERIARWFLPVTGDLRLGGTYQLEGNAGGEIRVCDAPHRLVVTWIMGEPTTTGDSSLVDVRLDAEEGGTRLTLEHIAVVPPEFWDQFGPGAVGVGWDLALVGLAAHLAGEELGDPAALESDPAMRSLMVRSAAAWGEALRASGADDDTVARTTAATTAFYVPEA